MFYKYYVRFLVVLAGVFTFQSSVAMDFCLPFISLFLNGKQCHSDHEVSQFCMVYINSSVDMFIALWQSYLGSSPWWFTDFNRNAVMKNGLFNSTVQKVVAHITKTLVLFPQWNHIDFCSSQQEDKIKRSHWWLKYHFVENSLTIEVRCLSDWIN